MIILKTFRLADLIERDRLYLASLESLDNGKPFQVVFFIVSFFNDFCLMSAITFSINIILIVYESVFQDAYNIDLGLTIKCYR